MWDKQRKVSPTSFSFPHHNYLLTAEAGGSGRHNFLPMDNHFVYHYTSLEALQGILNTKLCLWATRYDKLNDPSEQIWAEKYVLSTIKQLKDYCNDTYQTIIDWFRKDAYILSLCKQRDDRNMWRLYCSDGRGVCLILDMDVIREYGNRQMLLDFKNSYSILEDVLYSSEEEIEHKIELCKEKENFNLCEEEEASKWMRIVPFIKNKDFYIENELRFAVLRDFDKITIPFNQETNSAGDYIVSKNEFNVKYRMRGNDLIPYIIIEFPIEALKGIIVGYEVDYQNAHQYINKLKEHHQQYAEIPIIKSNLFSSFNKKEYCDNVKLRKNVPI